MASQPTHQTEPASGGFSDNSLFHLLERNQGRLHVLHYASFGLKHERGSEAACLTWVIADVITDIEEMKGILTHPTSD